MIFEIALGIVAAVLILVFLPEILALGALTIGVAVLLAIVAVVLYFVFAAPELSITLLALAAVLVGGIYLQAQDGPTARRLERFAEIVGFCLVVLLVAGLFFIGALIVYLELVPLVIPLALLLPALIVLAKIYNDVFGFSPNQRKFLEKVALGVKWLPDRSTARPNASDEAAHP